MNEDVKRTPDGKFPYVGKDNDGDGFIDTVPVEITNSLPTLRETRYVDHTDALAPDTNTVFLELAEECILHSFDAYYEEDNSPSVIFYFLREAGNWVKYGYPFSDSGRSYNIRPSTVNRTSLFKKADEINMVQLAREIRVNGVKIELKGHPTEEKKIAVSCVYSLLKKD
jgi:hypothetical protein